MAVPTSPRAQKRTRDSLTPAATGSHTKHPQVAAPRRVDSVIFGGYEIRPGYLSPYPLDESILPTPSTSTSAPASIARKVTTRFVSPELDVPQEVAVQVKGEELHVEDGGGDDEEQREAEEVKALLSPELVIPPSLPNVITQVVPVNSPPVSVELQAAVPGPAQRGHAGRFLPKPAGTTVKAQRLLKKAIAPPPPLKTGLTVKEQRDVDRKKREEKDRKEREEMAKITKRMFVCDWCFKYMISEAAHVAHKKACTFKGPPGRKVYQRGAHIIWEVDGAQAKLYCQNLCLFSKLFIEHKYMFFDVEGFLFYILTDATPSHDYAIAYFSKEKISYDDNNLACIVTFPPYQKKGYGTLLIEFSYELSRRTSHTPGSPERPLSSLGERGYVAYWTGCLVRYFRAVFASQAEPSPLSIFGLHTEEDEAEARKRRNRRSRGWEGELPADDGLGRVEWVSPRLKQGGLPMSKDFEYPTSLEDIAEATNIRTEDVAFALIESGLAQWRRKKVKSGDGDSADSKPELDEIVITLELVEQVATKKGVRPRTMMDIAHVLL